MKPLHRTVTRRRFLEGGARGLGVVALAGLPGVGHAAGNQSNPFAYDVERLTKTDPKLLQFEQVSRFTCPVPEPRRVALGPDNHLYVAARTGVCVLDVRGQRIADVATDSPARGLAFGDDGTLYVALRERIEVFNQKGSRLATWEMTGRKPWLTALAVGANDLFAADSGNRVVLRYDRSGKPVGRIGEKNKDRNVPGLIVPSPYLDVKLARDGLLRVNNPGRHCIEAYTADGDLELSWGKASAAIDGFCGCCNPVGLAMLPDARHVTCEKGLPRVKIYSAEGKLACVVAGTESFPENARAGSVHGLSDGSMGGLDATVDAQGTVYILDLVATDIRVMKPKA